MVFRNLAPVISIVTAVVLVAAPAGADREDDQRIAKEVSLVLADLPDGWEAEPSDDLGEETGLDECKRVDRATQAGLKVAYHEFPLFIDGNDPEGDTNIEGALFVFPKPKGAKRYFKAFNSERARDCFQEIGEQAVAAYPTSEVGTADLDVSAGDDAVGYRLDISASDDTGATDQAAFDFVIIRVGRAVLNLGGRGAIEPPSLDDAIDTVLDRIEQEL